MSRKLVAIAVSDIHLSIEPPVFRSTEDDWLEVQRSVIEQVFTSALLPQRAIDELTGTRPRVPVLIAGDVFNRATPTPEVINFALKLFSSADLTLVAIPGNHDLPNHRLEEMHRSAYGTLVEAGVLLNIRPGSYVTLDEGPIPLRVWGYPCGCPVQPPPDKEKGQKGVFLEIALVHSYIWEEGFGHAWASEGDKVPAYRKRLDGYDVAVFGDNHQGFYLNSDTNTRCSILNCGSLLRRRRNQDPVDPSIGLIYSDGTVERKPLAVGKDKYLEEIGPNQVEVSDEEEEAIRSLAGLEEQEMDFEAHLRNIAEKGVERKEISKRAGELILQFLEA